MARVSEYLGFHFALHPFARRQLLATRLVLEGGSLPYVAEALANDPALGDSFQQWVAAGADLHTMHERIQHDLAFHIKLIEASGVGPTVVFANMLQIFFDLFATEISDHNWAKSTAQHAQLVSLLAQGQVDAARRLLDNHLAGYRELVGD
jgi:DNA-binding FadR family transcriptional regulator